MTFEILINGQSHRLEMDRKENQYVCRLDGESVTVDAVLSRPNVLSLLIDGKAWEVKREVVLQDLHFWVNGARYDAEVRDPRSLRSRRAASQGAAGPSKLVAPMPGKVVRVLVRERDEVEAGQAIVVVEAMKMQNELKSLKNGIVSSLQATEGAAVNPGDVLAIIE